MIKADAPHNTLRQVRWAILGTELLGVMGKLLKTEGLEDRVKLCFILGKCWPMIVLTGSRTGFGQSRPAEDRI